MSYLEPLRSKKKEIKNWIYTGYKTTFDSRGLWSFYNEFAENVIIFGVDKYSSSHTHNYKTIFYC